MEMKLAQVLIGFLLCTTVQAQVKPTYAKKYYSKEGVLGNYSEWDNDGRIFYKESYDKEGGIISTRVYCYDSRGWMRYEFATAFTIGDTKEKDLLRVLVYQDLSDSTQGFRRGAFRITLPDSLTKIEYLKQLYLNDEMETLMNPETFEDLSEMCTFMVDENGLKLSNEFYSGVLDLYGQARYEHDYDSRGRIVEERFGRVGKVSKTKNFEYDDFNRVVKQTIRFSYSDVPTVIEYYYDDNGNLFELIESPFSYSVKDEENKARFGGASYVRKEISFRREVYTFVWIPHLKEYKWTRKEEYYEKELIGYAECEYNDRGDLVVSRNKSKDSPEGEWRYEYEYFD